jgi:hypothetical protein
MPIDEAIPPGSETKVRVCPRCSSANPVANRFCSSCGAALALENQEIERFIDERLSTRIREELKKNLADQKTVEIETAELIAERALKWARTFGFFVGIPLALCGVILGFIGLRTWTDISTAQDKIGAAAAGLTSAQKDLDAVKRQTTDIATSIQQTKTLAEQSIGQARTAAEQRISDLIRDADDFKQQLDEARARLAAIPELQDRTSKLENDVRNLKNFANRSGVRLSSEVQARIDELLGNYKKFLTSIGVNMRADLPDLRVAENNVEANGAISYYDPESNQIVIDRRVLDDSGVLLREFTHHVISGTPEALKHYDIESLLAFYLPASFLDEAKIGVAAAKALGSSADYFIDFEASSKYDDYAKLAPETKPYQGAQILGAIFWDVRRAIGHEAADPIMYRAWQEFLRSGGDGASVFMNIYIKQYDLQANARYKSEVRRVLKEHGAPLPS